MVFSIRHLSTKMYSMKVVILFALLGAALGSWDPGLRVKFNIGLGIGSDFFYEVATTKEGAIAAGWVLTDRPDDYLPSLSMYCYEDYIVCAHYSDTGDVCGIQYAFPVDDFSDSVYDWATQGFIEWTVNSKTYQARHQYFVSEDYMNLTETERAALRSVNEVLPENGVYFVGTNREMMKVSDSIDDVGDTSYTKQSCIPWMGLHYFYNMTTELECSAESLYPWFLLYQDGQLVGSGGIAFGKLNIDSSQRDWFETPDSSVIGVIAPTAPDCLSELAESNGVITIHIYYVANPWWILCLFQ